MPKRKPHGEVAGSQPRSSHGTLEAILAALAILGISSAIFLVSAAQMRQTAYARLDAQADESMFQIGRRYETAVTMLRSMRGLYYASEEVTLDEFDLFFRTSGFREMFPHFGVVGYAPRVSRAEKEGFEERGRGSVEDGGTGYPEFAITPPGDRDEYWPVYYSVPTLSDRRGLGWDMLTEPTRRAAIERARDIGDITISDEIVLLADGKLGSMIAAPMYATKDVPKSLEERRASFSGALGVTFAYDDFPMGALAVKRLEDHLVSVLVGPQGHEISFLVSSAKAPRLSSLYGVHSARRRLQLNERETVEVTFQGPAAGFLTAQERLYPFGLALTTLLAMLTAFLIVILLRRGQSLSELRQRYGFVSTMSHQLRTPLTKMQWSVDSLLDSGVIKDGEAVDAMRGDVATLNAIVNDLLLFLEWGEMRTLDAKAKPVPVSSVVEAALAKVKDASAAGRVRVDLGGAAAAKVRANLERLSTALWFLLDNALTYSRKGSPVAVTASMEGRNVAIRVVDRGYGIPKDEQVKVWENFFRASNASLGKNAGSGVGVPLCAIVVKAHGGTIDFASEEGIGTTFVVRLPARR